MQLTYIQVRALLPAVLGGPGGVERPVSGVSGIVRRENIPTYINSVLYENDIRTCTIYIL